MIGRPIIVDFSPVTDFREATCRQYEENTCNRGGYCNFMHLKRISRDLRRQLFGRYRRRHSRSRSRSPYRQRSHEDRSHSGNGRRYDDRDKYYESRSRRHRSTSPSHRRGRSRSPGGRRYHSPVREGSEERRAKIEQWNREREQQEEAYKGNTDGGNNDQGINNDGLMQNGNGYHSYKQQPEQGGNEY
ncbi:splicing factor U2af small subunit A [Citrus sinensis]|nr:splicing factor U2af small subunit A [Citrus sinensis]